MEKGGKGFLLPGKGAKSSLKSTPTSLGKDSSANPKRGRKKVQFESEGSPEDNFDFSSKSNGKDEATYGKGGLGKGGKVGNVEKTYVVKESLPLELRAEASLGKDSSAMPKRGRKKVQFESEGSPEENFDFSSKSNGKDETTYAKGEKVGNVEKTSVAKESLPLELRAEASLRKYSSAKPKRERKKVQFESEGSPDENFEFSSKSNGKGEATYGKGGLGKGGKVGNVEKTYVAKESLPLELRAEASLRKYSSAKPKRERKKVQFESEGSPEENFDFSSKSNGKGEATYGKGGLGKGGKVGNVEKTYVAKESLPLELRAEDIPKNAKCMMDCEAADILEGIQDHITILRSDPTIMIPVSFEKALQYAKIGSRYTDPKSVKNVLGNLSKHGVTEGEICMIANVCPESVEEAFALVPSLKGKRSNVSDPLKDALTQLAMLKNPEAKSNNEITFWVN